ncbi:hypothetical protein SmJEL517_g01497 [Synchytrium microbalum]|uniref:Vacuolar fusion protein MON1 n=1 Tax=Synchytrium microbalum TaxID=1806994 RepID=A0A507C3T8_9FUNG|nr:uncharacterized protein SmJEL517_g01497 [Synchytrium microbalum]TPX36200.1 hypothetical protein SmJEL517_g01497 [Synchytrium microbalum]
MCAMRDFRALSVVCSNDSANASPDFVEVSPFSPETLTDDFDIEGEKDSPELARSSREYPPYAASPPVRGGVSIGGGFQQFGQNVFTRLAAASSSSSLLPDQVADVLGELDVSLPATPRRTHDDDDDDSMPTPTRKPRLEDTQQQQQLNNNTSINKGNDPDSDASTPRNSVLSPARPIALVNTRPPPIPPQGDFVDGGNRLYIDDGESIKSGFQRKNGHDGPNSERWIARKKHFFVLSSAGKPIYTRYGDESKLSSYMGVIQAIVSFIASEDDTLKCINAGAHKFVFASRGPLYLVAVSSTGESENQLREQIQYLYNQILFILTSAQLTRIFEQRVNYDLRNLLAGTENLLDELSNSFQKTASHYLSAINPLRMSHRLRTRIGAIMTDSIPKTLAFAMIIAKERLVTLIRPKTHSLHPSDLLLLINLLAASPGMKTSESWTPICLPRFNPRNHLHVYVCYVARDVAMILVGPERDAFFEFSEYKTRVVKAMTEQGCFEGLEDAIKMDPYSINEVGVPILRHFIFKSRALVQYTQPGPSPPYTNKQDWKRLLLLYQHAHSKLYKRPHGAKVVFNVGSAEAVLAVATTTHELYASFSPLIPKTAAVAAANGLQKWVQRWEQGLFLTKAPSF